jgi:hypothetical protein
VDASVETGYLLTPTQRRATLETNPKIRLFMLCNSYGWDFALQESKFFYKNEII